MEHENKVLQLFIFDQTEHQVTIDRDGDELLFRASDIGNILGIVNIRSSIVDFDENELRVRSTYTSAGTREALFLTERGVYHLLFHSRKPIAKPFQKWVFDVIREINRSGRYEVANLKEKVEESKKRVQEAETEIEEGRKRIRTAEEEALSAKHTSLLSAFHAKYVVYFGNVGKVECDSSDGPVMKHLIKIGSTKDLRTSCARHEQDYSKFSLLHVIECSLNENFEKYLHRHQDIRKFWYREPVKIEGGKSNEVFLVTEEELGFILRVAKANIHKFRSGEIVVNQGIFSELQEIKEAVQGTRDDIDQLSTKVDMIVPSVKKVVRREVQYAPQIKARVNTKGTKVQKYSPNGKTLLKTYDSAIEATRDPELDQPSRSQMKIASEQNRLYKNFRWAMLDRDKPDDTLQVLAPTVAGGNIKKGLVAMLNLDKNKIVNVFCDQKAASEDRKFANGAAISKAMKQGTQSGGHYFQFWDNCEQAMKDEWLETNQLPEERRATNSKVIERLDAQGNVTVFQSIQQIQKDYQVGRKTIMDAIASGYQLKGYRWRFKVD